MRIRGTIHVLVLAVMVSNLLWLYGCGKDPDPCKGLSSTTAKFNFQQKFYGIDSIFNVDTILLDPFRNTFIAEVITFNSIEDNATYTWKIGEDPRTFSTKSFNLNFNDAIGKIETKLVVNKQPNTTCFPKDNGIDSTIQNLYVLSGKDFKYAFEGTFTGYDTNNSKEIFDITIVDFGPIPYPDPLDPPGHYGLRIYNLPKDCGNNNFTPVEYTPVIKQRTYKHFYIEHDVSPSSCGLPFSALGRVYDHNNKISITFLSYDFVKKKLKPTSRKFIGSRKK